MQVDFSNNLKFPLLYFLPVLFFIPIFLQDLEHKAIYAMKIPFSLYKCNLRTNTNFCFIPQETDHVI